MFLIMQFSPVYYFVTSNHKYLSEYPITNVHIPCFFRKVTESFHSHVKHYFSLSRPFHKTVSFRFCVTFRNMLISYSEDLLYLVVLIENFVCLCSPSCFLPEETGRCLKPKRTWNRGHAVWQIETAVYPTRYIKSEGVIFGVLVDEHWRCLSAISPSYNKSTCENIPKYTLQHF